MLQDKCDARITVAANGTAESCAPELRIAVARSTDRRRNHRWRGGAGVRGRNCVRAYRSCTAVYLASFATCALSRETLRLAVFLWITPLPAARMISGSARFSADAAVD